MNKTKRITFKNLNLRSTEKEGKKCVEGIIPYDSRSVPIWGVTEVIERGAFKKTLSESDEVRALWNHDDSLVLGSSKSGTLDLEDTADGLICRCELPNTTYANDLYEIITRGDVRTMSFGFRPIKWQDSDNGKFRTLKEVQLDEVSFGVAYPAYPETNSQTYMRGFMKRKIDIESINEILEKEELSKEDVEALQEAVSAINKIIKEATPQDEAAKKEPPEESTPRDAGTPTKDEEVKKELLALIDTLFEIEKEEETE